MVFNRFDFTEVSREIQGLFGRGGEFLERIKKGESIYEIADREKTRPEVISTAIQNYRKENPASPGKLLSFDLD